MAKERYVNTKFWNDTYIINLDPIEKLLYLYFLTNPLANISGVYEISLRQVAFDTGIDKDMILKILERFEEDKKMFYKDGWLCIKNFLKHQKMTNPKIKKGVILALKEVSKDTLELFISYGYLMDSLSIADVYLSNNTNLNSNSNSNSNTPPRKRGNDKLL